MQIVLEDRERGYMQMFVDIAENAKGITKTIQARFDSNKVANRVMLQLIQTHPLLIGRIEEQVDRVTDVSQILAAKHVTDVVRAVAVGLGGRVSGKREETMNEQQVLTKTSSFLTVLARSFPEVQAVQEGKADPGELRRTSLIGSATMLRVLAGMYHDLTEPPAKERGEAVPPAMTDDEIVDFLMRLRPHMGIPVTDRLWIDTGLVEEGAGAPRARGGDMARLAETLVQWARDGRLPGGEQAA